jgi:hypothetical protein
LPRLPRPGIFACRTTGTLSGSKILKSKNFNHLVYNG